MSWNSSCGARVEQRVAATWSPSPVGWHLSALGSVLGQWGGWQRSVYGCEAVSGDTLEH